MADSDIILVHKVSRDIEEVLCDRFGADGRGLHEKLSSVNHLIPDRLENRIRWLASLRNKVSHENFDLPNPEAYRKAGEEAFAELQRLANQLENREKHQNSVNQGKNTSKPLSDESVTKPINKLLPCLSMGDLEIFVAEFMAIRKEFARRVGFFYAYVPYAKFIIRPFMRKKSSVILTEIKEEFSAEGKIIGIKDISAKFFSHNENVALCKRMAKQSELYLYLQALGNSKFVCGYLSRYASEEKRLRHLHLWIAHASALQMKKNTGKETITPAARPPARQ
jgi:hypothetical protein